MAKEPRPLVDKRAAAAYLGVSQKWVDKKVSEREIPFIKLGRLVRFDPDALDAFIAANTHAPGRRRAG